MSLGSKYQLCLGQKFGFEYAIHHAVLLIDAKNAFKSINRKLILKNMEKTCLSTSTAIKNSYYHPFNLFANKKISILKKEEVTTTVSASNGHVRSSHYTLHKNFISRQRDAEILGRRRKRSR